MGVVYGALDTTMRRSVAIKLISPDPSVDDEVVSRFLREAKNTAKIHHPNIVHVFDLGKSENGELFFVMELLEGESLSQRLRKVSHFSPEVAVHIGRQICSALAYAHESGIIHRDLKPANVMVVPTAEDPHFAKVLDFGVAKAQDQGTQLTRTGMLVGTVEYMAPEQIMGRPVDARTDIYALGVILYRMLTGTPLFRDSGSAQVINQHINETPEPLRRRAPEYGIPAALDALVLRCLAKRPEGRFETMHDVEDALAAALEPGAEPSPSWGARAAGFDDNIQTELARRPGDFDDSDEPHEATRVEGRKLGGATAPPAAPARPVPLAAQTLKSMAMHPDLDFEAPQTLVMPGQGRPSYPSAPSFSGPHAHQATRPIGLSSPGFYPPAQAPAVPAARSRLSAVHVIIAAVLIVSALSFCGVARFSAESIVALGVGIILASVVLLLGLRRGEPRGPA